MGCKAAFKGTCLCPGGGLNALAPQQEGVSQGVAEDVVGVRRQMHGMRPLDAAGAAAGQDCDSNSLHSTSCVMCCLVGSMQALRHAGGPPS